MAKCEIAHDEQFLLWPQCFQLFLTIKLSSIVIFEGFVTMFSKSLLHICCMWERVKLVCFSKKNSQGIVIPLASSSFKNLDLTSYLKNFPHFVMKLGTHVPRNNTHVYTKSHNSGLNKFSVMPLFST